MGGSKVYFDLNAGASYSKGKKRMRGELVKGPEIKKWNAFMGSGQTLSSINFVNTLIAAGANTANSYVPQTIVYPSAGNSDSYRVGNRINLLGIRFKGWIAIASDQIMQIRWRLNLVRVDIPDQSFVFSRVSYLQQFENADTSVPSSFDIASFGTFSRHNFYKKFKDVNNKAFKCKTLASGVVPATNDYRRIRLSLLGSIAGQTASLNTTTQNPSYVGTIRSEPAGYIPIDISVKLNDTVDCLANLRRYYVVLETDVGYGWDGEGAASGSDPALVFNMYARGYYTDA